MGLKSWLKSLKKWAHRKYKLEEDTVFDQNLKVPRIKQPVRRENLKQQKLKVGILEQAP